MGRECDVGQSKTFSPASALPAGRVNNFWAHQSSRSRSCLLSPTSLQLHSHPGTGPSSSSLRERKKNSGTPHRTVMAERTESPPGWLCVLAAVALLISATPVSGEWPPHVRHRTRLSRSHKPLECEMTVSGHVQ